MRARTHAYAGQVETVGQLGDLLLRLGVRRQADVLVGVVLRRLVDRVDLHAHVACRRVRYPPIVQPSDALHMEAGQYGIIHKRLRRLRVDLDKLCERARGVGTRGGGGE